MNVLALEKEIIAKKHTASKSTVGILHKIETIEKGIMDLKHSFPLIKFFGSPYPVYEYIAEIPFVKTI